MSELMEKRKLQTSKVIWRYVKLKGKQQSKEMTARQNMGTERMVRYSEMIRSNKVWGINFSRYIPMYLLILNFHI